MKIHYTKSFDKQYKKLSRNIQDKVDARLGLFIANPFEPLLGNHGLHGEKQGYRSINITGDYRALYVEVNEEVYFVAVGTHSELYG